jgi:F-type H+-transporting ATPase subunit a
MVHISPKAEEIFFLGNFPVTNTLILIGIVFVGLLVVSYLFKRKFALVPGSFQNVVEFAVEGVLGMMEPVFGSRKKAEKYLPWIATFFILILLSNWLGLFPGVGSIIVKGEHGSAPLLRAPASDLNFTIALAIISVIIINYFGIKVLGLKLHLKKFFDFRSPIKFFIGILELVSEIAKIISFSFRLFGNVFAGEVLLTIIVFLVPYFIPLPFLMFEVFVGFMQAFVFSMLTMVFIAMAISHAEH